MGCQGIPSILALYWESQAISTGSKFHRGSREPKYLELSTQISPSQVSESNYPSWGFDPGIRNLSAEHSNILETERYFTFELWSPAFPSLPLQEIRSSLAVNKEAPWCSDTFLHCVLTALNFALSFYWRCYGLNCVPLLTQSPILTLKSQIPKC